MIYKLTLLTKDGTVYVTEVAESYRDTLLSNWNKQRDSLTFYISEFNGGESVVVGSDVSEIVVTDWSGPGCENLGGCIITESLRDRLGFLDGDLLVNPKTYEALLSALNKK